MSQSEMRAMGIRLLNEARALRSAFPDTDAMREMPVSDLPPDSAGEAASEYRTALRYLHDEMLLVRSGKADSLTVLDDEIACVERLLPHV
jgi:hypothetical protein